MSEASIHQGAGKVKGQDSKHLPAIEELASIDHWVCWKYGERAGKKTKVPYQVGGTRKASSTDEGTWSSYEQCRRSVNKKQADGVGFVLDGTGDLVAFDLDDCFNDEGELTAAAQEIADRLNSYTEVTPSGNGIRVIVRGKIPDDGRRTGKVEVYQSGRYITVTGDHLEGYPERILRRPKAVSAVFESLFGNMNPRQKGNGLDHELPPLPEPWSNEKVERYCRIFEDLIESYQQKWKEGGDGSASVRDCRSTATSSCSDADTRP